MASKAIAGTLAALGLLGIATTAHARHCATVYEHVNYAGERMSISVGEDGRLGPWGDHISSIRVAPGCVFNAYEHASFGGDQKTFSGNVRRVGTGWNDRISSYSCTCR